jgi:hypothetical protein
MDTVPATQTPLPGVAQITYPDGTSEYRYTDELQAAIDRAEANGYAPAVQPPTTPQPITIQLITPQSNLPALPADRGPHLEQWMVRSAAVIGLAGGGAALAPVIAEGVASISAGLGSMLMIALQIGGPAVAALILINLFAGKKTGPARVLEVTQTIQQTITQVTRVGE